MRQLLLHAPPSEGARIVRLAGEHGSKNTALLQAECDGKPASLVFAHVPNDKVEKLLDALAGTTDLRITLDPRGIIPLAPGTSPSEEQAVDVAMRSPIEVFLSGLQSVGSWTGFLGYAAAAGVVVWIGLVTNTIYLLTAAMLIAPFAGPAMNAAIASARGDVILLRRSLLRYFASLLLTITVAGLLSLAFQQDAPTEQMVERSQVSAVAVLLPLVAGAAGALNLMQSERSSLVSGAATGMLVAASLAPPAGVVGMSLVIGEWQMARDSSFVLLLQLAGINLSGAVIFRTFGLSPRGAHYLRGSSMTSIAAAALSLLALAGLLAWQFSSSPELQRSSRSRRALDTVRQTVNESGLAHLVEADVRFTRADIAGQNTLLVELFAQPKSPSGGDAAQIQAELTSRVQRSLLAEGFNVTPLVKVTVLTPPGEASPP